MAKLKPTRRDAKKKAFLYAVERLGEIKGDGVFRSNFGGERLDDTKPLSDSFRKKIKAFMAYVDVVQGGAK